ncbi:MAG TPA: helix-turn-helix transcriptional regulator [Caulobacterales bacterium]|nr:helix-turn-helix transcriptional regulator [Caulobacterales bacterium]
MTEQRRVNAIDRQLGQRLRARRLQIGMSQERLAEILGITFQQVQKYEKGVNRIAASRLFEIAAAVDLPPARFFEGLAGDFGADEELAETVSSVLATPEGAQLASLFRSIRHKRTRLRVIELVRSLAQTSR